MQKIIRRTQLAIAQAERRKARRKAIDLRDRWKNRNQNAGLHFQQEHDAIKRARLERREDWELGPLAPRRDVGDRKETYGTIPGHRLEGVDLRPEERRRRNARFGSTQFCSVKVGDRVVLLAGIDKGKIGKVSNVNVTKSEVKVEGLNKVDVEVPEWMQTAGMAGEAKFMSSEKSISFDDIRLVTALHDPQTGETRDVIVKELFNTNFYTDPVTRKSTWVRKIGGTNITIPWPKVSEPEKVDHPDDTIRIIVEEKTYVPTLLKPPMPPSVIDELRNKYSKFRTRHTDAYIAEKKAEEKAKEDKKRSIKKMRTPLNVKNRLERKLRKKKGKGILTAEMLAALGQVVAKNKGLGLVVKEAEQAPKSGKTSRSGKAPKPIEPEAAAEAHAKATTA